MKNSTKFSQFIRFFKQILHKSITLKNGQQVTFRSIDQTDYENISAIYQNLGESSQYLRFNFAATPAFIQKVVKDTVDSCLSNGSGIIAFITTKNGEQIPAGQARFVKTGQKQAELCVTIRDDFQGLGLGKLLMRKLIDMAKETGLDELEAYVNRQNKAMQSLLYKFQLPVFSENDGGMVMYRLVLNPKLVPQLNIAF